MHTMARTTATRWSVPPSLDLRVKRLDDEYVVYNPWSGDTHVLNATAGAALLALQADAHDAESLARETAGDADDDVAAQMRELLVEFQVLGLIEPADA